VKRPVLGLDVGGANLKAAHTNGAARSRPFALWKDPAGLAPALRSLIADMPAAEVLAVTMTGELCDCFESKREGVAAILDAVEEAAGRTPVRVFSLDGRFLDVASARRSPLQVAAANWLALALHAGPYAPDGPAVLIDIGSTTTDIVPLQDGRPVPHATTDPQRLQCGELVYTGVRRTPVCAVIDRVGAGAGLAAELFATTLDAYLILGMIPEDAADRNTADGRPATRAAAHARMARMMCADLETTTEDQRRPLAEAVLKAQASKIDWGLALALRGSPPPRGAILTGEGAFLARHVLARVEWSRNCKQVDLNSVLNEEISRAACAYAVACLAAEGREERPRDAITRR
jgi:(4-(4-[2-(gamma-L-glutamylamino)ethyl]phenoxymethyl)furan-2-yl)methanamine synthase